MVYVAVILVTATLGWLWFLIGEQSGYRRGVRAAMDYVKSRAVFIEIPKDVPISPKEEKIRTAVSTQARRNEFKLITEKDKQQT